MNNTINNTHNAHKKKLKYLAQIAILSAISAIIMLLEFPLWFAPPFYKLDFSEVPILIGSFAMGPISGILMELLKNLLNLILNGTTTNFVGEFANFVTGCALVVPAALIYKYKRTFAGAIIGILAGTLSLAVIGSLFNYFVLIPTFSTLYKLPIDQIIAMGTALNSWIKDLKTFVVLAVAPFNLFKGTVCSILVLLTYKRVSKILK